MTAPQGQLNPDPTPKIRPRWKILGPIIAALLLIAGAITWDVVVRSDTEECAPGVQKFEDADGKQCAGITDGSFHFSKDLGHVSDLIKEENDAVTKEAAKPGGAPYVSVVYAVGMIPESGDSNSAPSIRHEVEGAYTAQIQANRHRGQGDSPQIRLLLGNISGGTAVRDYTIDRIGAQRQSDRIIAAAGLGTSVTATKSMVTRLTAWDIASFGAVLTSDDLQEVRGLVRTAPPNADEAAAAVQFLGRKEYASSTVLIIKDANQSDIYTSTLASTFIRTFPAKRLADEEPMQYDSSKRQLATYFTNQMANLCGRNPGVVYFAGRGRDLPDFLAPLAHRLCKKKKLTVLSGDDVSNTAQADGFGDVKRALQNGNIRLIYTGLAHPGAWTKAPQFYDNDAIDPFQKGGAFLRTFPNDPLGDGQAIMAYDAMLTAVKAIRALPLENSGQPVPRKGVMQMLTSLSDCNAVPGASGWISYRNNGSPKDKAIPVIEVGSDGHTTTIGVSAGSGQPYRPPSCAVPDQ